MKKILSVVMIFVLVFSCIQFVYAESSSVSIFLSLAKDAQSLQIMNQSGLNELKNYASRNANTTQNALNSFFTSDGFHLFFQDKYNDDKGLHVTGSGEILIGSGKIPFHFENQLLKTETYAVGKSLYMGVIKSYVLMNEKRIPITIDFCSSLDFRQSIASVSFNYLEENGQVLFFGELFEEYEEYYNHFLNSNHTNFIRRDSSLSLAANYDKYAHVDVVAGTSFGSTSGAETIIMSVAKRDYRDRGSKEMGFELVRVFGRSANALSYVSGATSAYPVSADLTFKYSKKDFLDVMEITPDGDGDQMPNLFNVFSQLHPAVGTFFATVDLIYNAVAGGTSATIYAESGYSDENAASGTVAISGLNNMVNANLPASITTSNAKLDEEHGITWKVKYGTTGNDTPGSASVTVTANMDYRFYYDTHRSTVRTTGTISKTHFIYKS